MQVETLQVLDLLVKQLDEKILQLQEHVCYGNVNTFEEYKKVCGEVTGLLTARNYIKDLYKKMEDSDE